MKIEQTDEFKKDLKKLSQYPTLENDLKIIKQAIRVNPTGDGSKHWNILRNKDSMYICKMRMMCRSLRGKSLRLIYYYDGEKIELEFIEIYYKVNKASEDKSRIKEVWKQKTTER